MDLTTWLLSRTPVRPLVATTVGGTGVRLAVEREMRRHGWRPALNPAEANLLIVTGPADPAMTPFVEAVWEQIPVPRARASLETPAEVAGALSEAERRMRSRDEHSGSGHGDHRHDMGDMEMPGGIPMADRADDRDGLKLDRLAVPLGPLLPAWPPGLLVRTTLQGDVIQEATAEAVLTAAHGPAPFWDSVTSDRIAARRLDSCARLLTIAGWEYAAVTAARLRDDLLSGADIEARFARWAKRVRRSRVLRWSLTGIGAHAGSDALDRLTHWIGQATDAGASDSTATEDPAEILDALPSLLAGTEFATARLVVASLDPDLERLRVSHG
jgi:hypothetical protein